MIVRVGARCTGHPGVKAVGVATVAGKLAPVCQDCYQALVRQASAELRALRDDAGGDS